MGDEHSGRNTLGADHHGGFAPGWYPDPVGTHELRYYNGVSWTGDVATDGQRSVAPLTTPQPIDRDGSRLPLILGVIALSTSWIPFLGVLGMVLGVVAIIIGLRARHHPHADAARVGIVTGLAAVLAGVVGLWLSATFVRAMMRFNEAGDHEVKIVECAEVDNETSVVATITNLEGDRRSYVVTVELTSDESIELQVDDVEPGETREFFFVDDFRYAALDCKILEVTGPWPFGVNPEP